MNGKERSVSHINEDLSRKLFKDILPQEWVCRDYTPDYGIDMSIELFSKHGDKYFTDGEYIYIQLKSVENLNIKKIKVSNRYNMEKVEYSNYKNLSKEETYMDVIKYRIETSLLETVEKMSTAVPVLLVLVNVKEEKSYYVCLNDYIEKVIVPNKPEYYKQKTLTLDIPLDNYITIRNSKSIISCYSKRPKLYALFNKVSYQYDELKYCDCNIEMAKHFSHILMRMDVWNARYNYPAINDIYTRLSFFEKNHITVDYNEKILREENYGNDTDEKIYHFGGSVNLISLKDVILKEEVEILWSDMVNLAGCFEEVTKELNLPTYFSKQFK